jgi:hypothetical protein
VALLDEPARAQFALALGKVFTAGVGMSLVGLAASLFLPPVHFETVAAAAGGQMLAAEMANLEPDDEPSCLADAKATPNHLP